MGTRGSVGFIYENKYKATYNHFDSYPSGLGYEVVDFVNKVIKEKGFDKLKKFVKALKLVDENKKPTKAQIDKYKQFSDTGVSTGSLNEWYCLLRNLQNGEMLHKIYEGIVGHMIDYKNFIKDSLFCEWAYIINLDTMTLDVYVGFQKEADPNNRFGKKKNSGGYYPCKLILSLPLTKKIENSKFAHKAEKLGDEIYKKQNPNS